MSATLTATPSTANVDDYVTLEWSDLPKGRTVNLQAHLPSGDGGTLVVNTEVNSSYQYPVTQVGTTEFRLVQGNKVLATATVEVS